MFHVQQPPALLPETARTSRSFISPSLSRPSSLPALPASPPTKKQCILLFLYTYRWRASPPVCGGEKQQATTVTTARLGCGDDE